VRETEIKVIGHEDAHLKVIMQAEMSKYSPEQRQAMESLNAEAKKRMAEIASWDNHESVKENEMEQKTKVDTPFTDVTLPPGTEIADRGVQVTNSLRYTQATLAVEFARIFKTEIMALRDAGQKEYAHDDTSPFANFERAANDMGIDRKQVLWVYAMKHKDGIASFLKGHTSQREDVRGRINDLIVYMLLMYAMINEEVGSSGTRGLGALSE